MFEVSEETTVNVALSNAAGTPCASDSPVFEMELLGANGTSRVASGTVASGEFCPTVSSTLPAGTYYVAITTDEAVRAFDYSLSLQTL